MRTITFAHYRAAMEELLAFGFRELNNGTWVNNGFTAMINPILGSDKVRVAYWAESPGIRFGPCTGPDHHNR